MRLRRTDLSIVLAVAFLPRTVFAPHQSQSGYMTANRHIVRSASSRLMQPILRLERQQPANLHVQKQRNKV